MRRKLTVKGALIPHKLAKRDRKAVRAIYDVIGMRRRRWELNLYITGYDDTEARKPSAVEAE
jgi:hypothetical protein